MDAVYRLLTDDTPIRQGDIIKKKDRKGTRYGLIITADCDIAREKHRNHYTWIEILPMESYIEKKWAPIEIEKTKNKQSAAALSFTNKKLREMGLSVLSEEKFFSWLKESGPDDFVRKISPKDCPQEIKNTIDGLYKITSETDTSPIENLKAAAPLFGIKIEKLIESARLHLKKGEEGFPDFFFLPNLPEGLENGGVALLRHIYSVHGEEIYTCEANAKIDGKSDSFYRTCRLNDRVKYSAVQKTTFLFSRIGMTSEYEDLTTNSIDNISTKIFETRK